MMVKCKRCGATQDARTAKKSVAPDRRGFFFLCSTRSYTELNKGCQFATAEGFRADSPLYQGDDGEYFKNALGRDVEELYTGSKYIREW